MVGLEIKRGFLFIDLSSIQQASLLVAAALGGMVVPALIYRAFTSGEAASGWGIPVAMDIAFVLGLINLVRHHVARYLKVFVNSLAVVDDIGAVLVMALTIPARYRISKKQYPKKVTRGLSQTS